MEFNVHAEARREAPLESGPEWRGPCVVQNCLGYAHCCLKPQLMHRCKPERETQKSMEHVEQNPQAGRWRGASREPDG